MLKIDPSLTYERLVNISIALSLQGALVNEIYPEMRRVVGCISHERKRVVILVIHNGEMSQQCREGIEGVLDEVIVEAPLDYKCSLQIERLDYPNWYAYNTSGWHCFFAYFPHESTDLSTVHMVSLSLGKE